MRISAQYLEEQKRLHAAPRGYGTRGSKWAETVAELAINMRIRHIVDYGAGQGTLGQVLRSEFMIHCRDYDPAVERFQRAPTSAALVACTDVLEHIEPDCIDDVVAHLGDLADPWLFVVISLIPTEKTLSDGRQAHILLRPRQWWIDKLGERFELVASYDGEKYRPDKQFVALFRRTA